MLSTECGMQQLLYRRGGVRAPRWLGRVHDLGRGLGLRGWHCEAGPETMQEQMEGWIGMMMRCILDFRGRF
jgi:hypothetical protein